MRSLSVLSLAVVVCGTTLFASDNVAPEKAGVRQGDRVFEGPWVTTNRKLDGIMTAILTDLGDDKWQGRFYGMRSL